MNIGQQPGARDAAREASQRLRVGKAWMDAAAQGTLPRQGELAESLGLSVHQVGRALRWLEARGVAVVSDRRRAPRLLDLLPTNHPTSEGIRKFLDERSAQNRGEDG